MSDNNSSVREPTWSDTSSCPFCGSNLSDPGAGFVDHIGENPDCEGGFEMWRTNVGDDMYGGWSG